ncbi:MAG: ATP-binding protein [Chthoniobacteraceae bacterium]
MDGWKLGKSSRVLSTAFRTRLQLTIMLVVGVVTAGTLYFAQQKAQQDNERSLRMQFQSRIDTQLVTQESRQAAVVERCRLLAHNVRITAALDEQDLDDLYLNAKVELRDVLADGRVTKNQANNLPRADFVRFLNARGDVLSPEGEAAPLQPWERQLAAAGAGPEQQIGYVEYPSADGTTKLEEVVATTIIGSEGEPLGALVLGFPFAEFSGQATEGLKTGLWLNHELHLAGIAVREQAALVKSIKATLEEAPGKTGNPVIPINGEPHLMFYKILNPGSRFPIACELCFYSLTDALAQQRWLQWEIVGTAALLLVGGLLASHFISAGFSKPVEELAEHSEEHKARREMAEAALVVTEQKYQSIFENAIEGIFVLSPEGLYLNANPALARIFGFESAAQLMTTLSDPASQLYAEPERHEQMLQQACREGMVANAEAAMRRRDGSTIWTSQSVRAIYDEAGRLQHFEGTLVENTERKHAADAMKALNADLEKALTELKATQNQMIQQERLRALGQMASGIAHDFNNALMPVLGFAELLVAKPALLNDQPKALKYLETIRTAAKDATCIVARLREFYRSNEGGETFKPVDLRKLAGQSITLTQPKWKGQAQSMGAEIHIVEKLDEVPLVAGDESALREVLTNLIFNAVDAMPKGGTITLATHREDSLVVLEVADSGTGMTEEVRARCLDPFFSTKGERGTGLGLAMVFGIIQRHGGEMDIRSEVGKGTAFVLRFPVATDAVEKEEPGSGEGTMHGLNVLVVDDEPQIREVLTAYLETDGHTVRTAGDGTNGLRQFLDERFDLVIADKAMPGMSGDQMAEAIRHFSPRMPVVLLSGFNTGEEDEPVEGVSVITAKPVTLSGLRESIEKAMQNP